MTTEILLRENWQKIEFRHSEAIPDQFQIDLRIAKVWGKAKALQTPKPESDHKMYQNLEFYGNFLCQKIMESIPDPIRINLRFEKVLASKILLCHWNNFARLLCLPWYWYPFWSRQRQTWWRCGGSMAVVWRSCGGGVAVVWYSDVWSSVECGRATAQEWF